jgi:hypothetical protein
MYIFIEVFFCLTIDFDVTFYQISNRQADRQTDGKKDEWTQVTGKNKQGPGELQHKV